MNRSSTYCLAPFFKAAIFKLMISHLRLLPFSFMHTPVERTNAMPILNMVEAFFFFSFQIVFTVAIHLMLLVSHISFEIVKKVQYTQIILFALRLDFLNTFPFKSFYGFCSTKLVTLKPSIFMHNFLTLLFYCE